MEKEKNTKTLMILMIICVCLSITTLGIVIYDRFIRKEPEHAVLKPITVDNQNTTINNDNKNYNTNNLTLEEDNNDNISIDYEKTQKDLIDKVNKNIDKIILKRCESCKGIDYDNSSNAKCSDKEMSVNSINEVINKLKTASKVELLPTSKACSLYTYTVGNDLVVFEADDTSILLVGLNNNGYAFHFPGENVVDFLSKLK